MGLCCHSLELFSCKKRVCVRSLLLHCLLCLPEIPARRRQLQRCPFCFLLVLQRQVWSESEPKRGRSVVMTAFFFSFLFFVSLSFSFLKHLSCQFLSFQKEARGNVGLKIVPSYRHAPAQCEVKTPTFTCRAFHWSQCHPPSLVVVTSQC